MKLCKPPQTALVRDSFGSNPVKVALNPEIPSVNPLTPAPDPAMSCRACPFDTTTLLHFPGCRSHGPRRVAMCLCVHESLIGRRACPRALTSWGKRAAIGYRDAATLHNARASARLGCGVHVRPRRGARADLHSALPPRELSHKFMTSPRVGGPRKRTVTVEVR